MPPAARLLDNHVCPMVTGIVPHVGGPIILGSFNVITVSMLQARVGDPLVCVGPPDVIVKGSATVLVNSMPAARLGDMTAHGGVIVMGAPTVIIGDGGGGGGGGGSGGGSMMAGGGASSTAGAINDPSAYIMTGSGGDYTNLPMTSSGALPAPAAQAKALKAAAATGAPFCERCAEAGAVPAVANPDPTKPGGGAAGAAGGAAGAAGGAAAAKPAAPPAPKAGDTIKPPALAEQSPTLKKQLDELSKDGWTIKYGASGGGSYAAKDAKEITIDVDQASNPAALTQTLSHEVGHAKYTVPVDASNKLAYVNSNLADEGAATLNNVTVQREILDATNKATDIGIAGTQGTKYAAAYDQFLKDKDAAKARTAIGSIFGNGETTSTTGESYSTYYGSYYDKYLAPPPPAKGP